MSGNQWYDASNNDYSSTYTNVTAEGTGAVAAGGDINAPVATTGGVAGIGNSVGNTTTTTTQICGVRVAYYAPLIFRDGFETGDTLRWSLTSP